MLGAGGGAVDENSWLVASQGMVMVLCF